MNESKILRIACDPKWYAHAYSEYLADVAANVSSLMTAMQEVLALDIEDETLIPNAVQDILFAHGIKPNARFIIGEYGEITANQLCINTWYASEFPDGWTSQLPYSFEEVFSIIRGSWTQSVISSKAFESYSIDTNNIVERITKFLQDIQSSFQVDDSVRDAISYYQSLISSATAVDDFISLFLKATGVDDADNTNDSASYINCDLYKYTGNTPGIALDFSTVNKAASATVSVVAKTIKGIFNIAVKGASWLFGKAKKYVIDTVIDPQVCEYIGSNESNEGFIDGFAWFGEFIPNVTYSHFSTGDQISNVFSGFYDEYATKWIKIKLKVGEFLFRIISDDIKWQCYFKPVAIDVDYFKENYTGFTSEPNYSPSNHQESIDEYVSWLTGVMACIQPLAKDATKDQIYKGLVLSTALTGSIAMFAFLETYEIINGSTITMDESHSLLNDISDYYDFSPVQTSEEVTNAEILLAASGNPTDPDNVHNYLSWSKLTGVSLHNSVEIYSLRTTMTDIIATWAMCRTERELYPADYTFVPYSNNHTSFSPSSWRIKSDTEIADTRDNFIERLILAVIIVSAAIFIGATAIKVSKAAFFKRQQVLSTLEAKMWNGGKLTSAERRKYIKYNKKQSMSRWLSVGSSESLPSVSNDNQTIIGLIQG